MLNSWTTLQKLLTDIQSSEGNLSELCMQIYRLGDALSLNNDSVPLLDEVSFTPFIAFCSELGAFPIGDERAFRGEDGLAKADRERSVFENESRAQLRDAASTLNALVSKKLASE